MEDLLNYLYSPVAQVALICGLAEIVKRCGCPKRIIPIVDVALGLISGICLYGLALNYGISAGINLGIAMGLSACGLFSGIKNVFEKKEEDDEENVMIHFLNVEENDDDWVEAVGDTPDVYEEEDEDDDSE